MKRLESVNEVERLGLRGVNILLHQSLLIESSGNLKIFKHKYITLLLLTYRCWTLGPQNKTRPPSFRYVTIL